MDIFPILIIVLATVVTIVAGYLVWDGINRANLVGTDTVANNTMKLTEKTLLNWDNMVVFVFLVLSIIMIVAASQVANNPAWFFISLVILVIAFTVAVAFSNAYEVFEDHASISTFSAKFSKTSFLLEQLPMYIIIMMFTTMLTMYVGYRVFA